MGTKGSGFRVLARVSSVTSLRYLNQPPWTFPQDWRPSRPPGDMEPARRPQLLSHKGPDTANAKMKTKIGTYMVWG